MDKQTQSRAPLIVAIVLLLLPVLYVGSYLALVQPRGRMYVEDPGLRSVPLYRSNYRIGVEVPRVIFWPLERIDRKLRPGAWESLPYP
jgi:hypothetical protein